MPNLPPDLYKDVASVLLPLLQTVSERQAHVPPGLGGTGIYARIEWEGSPDVFTSRLAQLLPPSALIELLQANRSRIGTEQQPGVDRLRERVNALWPPEEDFADPLTAYRNHLVRELDNNPRYQVDKRFVRLTLLLDQGPDAQGTRFIEPPDARTYDDLRTLLRENTAERAYVLLGAPGAGKSTLLRRLQLDETRAVLDASNGAPNRIIFLVPFNTYPRDKPPAPADWLAALWHAEQPALPDFATLCQAGHVLLLLDALNELRHHNHADLAVRIEAWRDFLPGFVRPGNTAVLSCRSLDYSAGLSTKDVLDVRQVNIKPMAREQVHAFLRAYAPDTAERAWMQLKGDDAQLKLFSTPFFLRLLVEHIGQDGLVPRGRAALFTGFMRAALKRELDARNRLLCDDDTLLDARDRARVTRNEWRPDAPGDLPERGCLIPKLGELAFQMQRSGLHGEGAQVSIAEPEARTLLAHLRARDILDAGVHLNVLDEDLRTDEVQYVHQLLQEYFAARTLAARYSNDAPALVRSEWRAVAVHPSLGEALDKLADYEPLPLPPSSGWEETAVIAAALALHADEFVRDLADANLPLAGRCGAAPGARVSAELKADLQARLLARMTDPIADLRARIAAGLALGDLGDPRFVRRSSPHGGNYLAPPLITIPASDYPIGDDASDQADEKPAHTVQLAEFQIGQYLVTNAEYTLFMAAGGYEDERWWDTPAAQAWRRGESNPEDLRKDLRDRRAGWQRQDEESIRRWSGYTSQEIDSIITLRNLSDEEFESMLAEVYPSNKRYRQPGYSGTIRPTATRSSRSWECAGMRRVPIAPGCRPIPASHSACRPRPNGRPRRAAPQGARLPGATALTQRAATRSKATSGARRRWGCLVKAIRPKALQTCAETAGNGPAALTWTIPIRRCRTTKMPLERMFDAWCVAGRGTTTKTTRAHPTATGSTRSTVSTMSVFA